MHVIAEGRLKRVPRPTWAGIKCCDVHIGWVQTATTGRGTLLKRSPAYHSWAIVPQHIAQFRVVLSIVKVCAPEIQRECTNNAPGHTIPWTDSHTKQHCPISSSLVMTRRPPACVKPTCTFSGRTSCAISWCTPGARKCQPP